MLIPFKPEEGPSPIIAAAERLPCATGRRLVVDAGRLHGRGTSDAFPGDEPVQPRGIARSRKEAAAQDGHEANESYRPRQSGTHLTVKTSREITIRVSHAPSEGESVSNTSSGGGTAVAFNMRSEGRIAETLTADRGAARGATSTVTRALLACGVAAGPLYVVVGAIETLTRAGFDLRRHSLSLLSNGDRGWIHITMLVGTGLLTVAGAVGMRRMLGDGRDGTWGPRLVGAYGVGLIGAGVFVADPALGFPPGTPPAADRVSWHGLLHLVSGGLGFLSLIAACGVFAGRFASLKQRGWALFSVATGAIYLAAFVGIATGSQQEGAILTFVNLAFTGAVVLGWAWISTMAARLRKESAE